MPDHAPLPDTVAELHALVLEQQASIAKMQQEIAERDREIVERDQQIERLKAQIDKLRRMHFGRKSEQLERQIDRLETQLEDLATGSGVADVRRARARASSSGVSAASPKEALAPHLPREEHELEPDSHLPEVQQRHGVARRGCV
jgi:chromosome segregation ATPase